MTASIRDAETLPPEPRDLDKASAVSAVPAHRHLPGVRISPQQLTRVGGAVAGIAAFLAVWSTLHRMGIFPPALFPSVSEVLGSGRQMWDAGLLGPDLAASLRRAVLGFTVGCAGGFSIALLTGCTSLGRYLVQPLLRTFAPVPTIGLVPLAILWFGIGEDSKVVMVALGVLVPVWISSHGGLSSTPVDYRLASACLGARRWQTLTRVIVPEAFPDVVNGMRVGAAMAFVLIVVAEMTGTTEGLGYRIFQAQLFSQADRLIFCLVVLGVLGALADLLIVRLTRPLVGWASEEH